MTPRTQLQALPATPGGELTPAQRKFNQLLKRVDDARATLAAWDTHQPAFTSAYAGRVQPLWDELLASDTAVLQRLERLLDGKGLSKPEQRQVRSLITHMALDVLGRRGLGEADRSHWRRVHDAHAERTFEAVQAEELALLRDTLAQMTGIDLGDQTYRDEAHLMADLRAKMAAAAQARNQAHAKAEADPRPHRQRPRNAAHDDFDQNADQGPDAAAPATQRKRTGRTPTAAQLQRMAEDSAAQAQAQQSLRGVFRKLASALHPDRAASEHDRLRRTGLMQRVNEAYGREDLLALYALQLEIEQVDAAHIAQATAAQLSHFTRLLQAQLTELNADVAARAQSFCHDYQLDLPRGPKPTQLGRVLDDLVQDLRRLLLNNTHTLRDLSHPARTEQWLRELRRHSPW